MTTSIERARKERESSIHKEKGYQNQKRRRPRVIAVVGRAIGRRILLDICVETDKRRDIRTGYAQGLRKAANVSTKPHGDV